MCPTGRRGALVPLAGCALAAPIAAPGPLPPPRPSHAPSPLPGNATAGPLPSPPLPSHQPALPQNPWPTNPRQTRTQDPPLGHGPLLPLDHGAGPVHGALLQLVVRSHAVEQDGCTAQHRQRDTQQQAIHEVGESAAVDRCTGQSSYVRAFRRALLQKTSRIIDSCSTTGTSRPSRSHVHPHDSHPPRHPVCAPCAPTLAPSSDTASPPPPLAPPTISQLGLDGQGVLCAVREIGVDAVGRRHLWEYLTGGTAEGTRKAGARSRAVTIPSGARLLDGGGVGAPSCRCRRAGPLRAACAPRHITAPAHAGMRRRPT